MPTIQCVKVETEWDTSSQLAWSCKVRWSVSNYQKATANNWTPAAGPWAKHQIAGVTGWLFQHVHTDIARGPNYNVWNDVTENPDYWEMWVVVRRGDPNQQSLIALPCSSCKEVKGFNGFKSPAQGHHDEFSVGHQDLSTYGGNFETLAFRVRAKVHYIDWSSSNKAVVDKWTSNCTSKSGPWGFLPAGETSPGGASCLVTRLREEKIYVARGTSGRHTIVWDPKHLPDEPKPTANQMQIAPPQKNLGGQAVNSE